MALSKEQVFNFVKRPKEEEGGRLSRSTAYYLWYWENVYSKGRSWSWNWAAAIFGWAWAIYRGMYILLFYGLLFDVLCLTLCGLSPKSLYLFRSMNGVLAGIFLFFGLFGTRFYFRWMNKKIKKGVTSVKTRKWSAVIYSIFILTIHGLSLLVFCQDKAFKALFFD